MPECEIGRRAIRQHHLRHEGVEVDGVLREVLDVALVVVGKRAFGQPLAAPVEGHDRETARAQIAHRLEIFFNVFGAALQNDDGAPAARRRLPPAEAQSHPVRGLEDTGQPVIGHRIGGNRDKFHDAANEPLDEGCAPYRGCASDLSWPALSGPPAEGTQCHPQRCRRDTGVPMERRSSNGYGR